MRDDAPPEATPADRAATDGAVPRGPGVDSLRLAVAAAPGDVGGAFQVLVHVDGTEMTARGAGLGHGLTVSWAGNNHRDPALFRVTLQFGHDYQVFVDTPWHDHSPGQLASLVCRTLALGPGAWPATWHGIRPALASPPPITSPSWRREQVS